MQGVLRLPEEILQKQICTVCKKYLSYRPIHVTTIGITCGRCTAESDIDVISYVNSVFESLIFPCVNRYEECSQLLRFEDVPKHEEMCFGKKYSCPLCPEEQYNPNSLLCLLNHYRNVHKSDIISEPSIIMNIEVPKEHVYLYCNDFTNMIIFINIKFNGDQLSITSSTIVDSDKVKYNVSIVEDGCQKYYTTGEVCGVFGLNFNAHEVRLETLSLKHGTTSVLCNFDFDIFTTLKLIYLPNTGNEKCVSLKKNNAICIEGYGRSQNNFIHPTFPKKHPKIYIYKNPIKTERMELMSNKNLGEYYAFVYRTHGRIAWSLICDLCENYFATSRCYTEMFKYAPNDFFSNGYFICRVCFHNGLKHNFVKATHFNVLDSEVSVDSVLYYCRYECKKFFKAGELIIHEEECHLNTEEQLNDEKFGMRHFGNYFCINSEIKCLVLRSNVVAFKLNAFGNKGRIYMVTECFKCILFYEADKSYIRFRAAHQYSPDIYFVQFKVVIDGRLPVREEVNSFSINLIDWKKFFFCVFLRKSSV